MLSWLRKSLGITPATDPVAVTSVGHGGFNFEVVGEQSYQGQLRKASGGRQERGERIVIECRLRYEVNSHTHAPAVRVDTADGRTVGYFPADQAAIYASAFDELERGGHIAVCQGVLVGGQPDKPSFGIYLDFKPKLSGSPQ